MMKGIALLLNGHSEADLVEAFCSFDSMLTKVARLSGMSAERWTIDFDLSTETGLAEAEYRLRELPPPPEDFCCHLSAGPFPRRRKSVSVILPKLCNYLENANEHMRNGRTVPASRGPNWNSEDTST